MSLLRRCALLIALEGAALTALGVFDVVHSATGDPTNRAASVLAAVVAVLAGLGLVLLARGVDRGRTAARSPAVVLNVIALPVGVGLLQGGVWPVGVPLLAVAATVLYLFATPELRDTLRDG